MNKFSSEPTLFARYTGVITDKGKSFGEIGANHLVATTKLSNQLIIPTIYLESKDGFELWKEIASSPPILDVQSITKPVSVLSDKAGIQIWYEYEGDIFVANQFKERLRIDKPPQEAVYWKSLSFLRPQSPSSLILSLALDVERDKSKPLSGRSLKVHLVGKSEEEKLSLLEEIANSNMDVRSGVMLFSEPLPTTFENPISAISNMRKIPGLKQSLSERLSSLPKMLTDVSADAKTIVNQVIPTSSNISMIHFALACLDSSVIGRVEFTSTATGNGKLAYLGDSVLTQEIATLAFEKDLVPKNYQIMRSNFTDKQRLSGLFDHLFQTRKVLLTWDFFYSGASYTMRQKAEFIEALLGLFKIRKDQPSINHLIKILLEAEF